MIPASVIETAVLPDAICAGVAQLEGLDISNRRQAASIWHDTAVAALDAWRGIAEAAGWLPPSGEPALAWSAAGG